MNSPDDELDALIGAVDPTRVDQPPHRESDRYRSILETAMATPTDHDDLTEPPAAPIDPDHGRVRGVGRNQRRWGLGAAAAMLVVVVVGAAVALGSQGRTDPADPTNTTPPTTALGEIATLRGQVTISPTGEASMRRSTILIDGDDAAIESTSTNTEGLEPSESASMFQIGATTCEVTDEGTEVNPTDPANARARFGPSSAAVVAVLLSTATVVERTEDTVDGVTATRYALTATDETRGALSALSPGELSWFELEYPDQVDAVDLVVTGDVIRHIQVVTPDQTSTTKFWDFNGDIAVVAPTGPCADAVEQASASDGE